MTSAQLLAVVAEPSSVLQFTSDLVGHLAWPLVVLIAVVILRKQLATMMTALTARVQDLTHLEAGPVKADFKAGLDQIDHQLETAVEEGRNHVSNQRETRGGAYPNAVRNAGRPAVAALSLTTTPLSDTLALTPETTVFSAWEQVESSARSYLSIANGGMAAGVSTLGLLTQLATRPEVDRQVLDATNVLFKLRNQIFHGSRVLLDRDTVSRYVIDAARVDGYWSALATQARTP